MSYVALIAWIVTAMAGLFLLTIWLIEYDPDYQRAAATRLPVPVVCGHVLLAVGGLGTWVAYLITDKKVYCWADIGVLALIATLGFTMAVRWLGVYRSGPSPAPAQAFYAPGPASPTRSAQMGAWATDPPESASRNDRVEERPIPPERHFPVSVVIAHGIFAITTVTLVVLTAIGIGGG